MKIIVTTLNKHQTKYGLQTHIKKPNKALYVLGITKEKTIKKYITFVPERISYLRNISKEKYLKDYFPTKAYTNTKIQRERKYFYLEILRSQQLNTFLENYDSFSYYNPDFKNTKKAYYNPPFKQEKKKNKLVKGVYIKQYRELVEPKEELKKLQEQAYKIIIDVYKYKTNNNTHSYVRGRNNITNAKPHKLSKHFVKLDIKQFFDNINETFLKTSLFSLKEFAILQIDKNNLGENSNLLKLYYSKTKQFIDAVLNLAIYQGALPQGSPLSPVLSNIVMGEFDIKIQTFTESKIASKSKMIYTRYADDLTFSSFNAINLNLLIKEIRKNLVNTPLFLHTNKTTYLKSTQRVFITGVKISQQHELKYGHKKKDNIKKDIFQAIMSIRNHKGDLKENQELIGRINYMHQIEPLYTNTLITKYSRKFHLSPKIFYKYLTNLN